MSVISSRFSLICLPVACAVLLAGCDRQSPPKEQVLPDAVLPAPVVEEKAKQGQVKQGMGLESANGLRAELSYAFSGRPAPAASFKGADGRDVALTDFAGRPLLVNLWATWCIPCRVEMPTLDALAALESGQVTVIAIAQDLQGRKKVLPFFAETGVQNLEPYIDPQNRVWGAIGGTPKLPTTILYDSESREVWRVVGGVEWDDAEIEALLAEAE